MGTNPFTVNVISYSGHGFTCDGQTIAVIPQINNESKQKELRFLNLSGIARKFSETAYTITFIIASMCRLLLPK
jgi:hypothetical protein